MPFFNKSDYYSRRSLSFDARKANRKRFPASYAYPESAFDTSFSAFAGLGEQLDRGSASRIHSRAKAEDDHNRSDAQTHAILKS
jgi:hypothetical protein